MAVTRSVSPEMASATDVVPPHHSTTAPPTSTSPPSRATGSPVSSGISSGGSSSSLSAWTNVTVTGVTPSPKSCCENSPRTSIAPAASVTVSVQRAPATTGVSRLSPAASTARQD